MIISQGTRDALAKEFEAISPSYKNLADAVRGGFESIWITPALRALEIARKNWPQDDEE